MAIERWELKVKNKQNIFGDWQLDIIKVKSDPTFFSGDLQLVTETAKKKDMIGLLEAWEAASQVFRIRSKEMISHNIKLFFSLDRWVKSKVERSLAMMELLVMKWKNQLDIVWYHLFRPDTKNLWSCFSGLK